MGHLRLAAPLQQAGIKIIHGVENGEILPERVSQAEAVIFQREIVGKFDKYQAIVNLARQQGKPIIFELDDLLFSLPENHPDRQTAAYAPALLPILQALAEADLVTVSTENLRNVLLPYNSKTFVLPNYFDDELWSLRAPAAQPPDGILTIGYMGTDSHRPDLDYIQPVLLTLLERYPKKIRLHFWGAKPAAELLARPQVFWAAPQALSYPEFAAFFQRQSADIFIAPLVDSQFNRSKSPLKFFEYSALGAPGIFSNVEPYSGLVSHGQNGLLAASLTDWETCLVRLIEDEDLRRQLALGAQQTIQKNWLLSANAWRWQAVFEHVFEAPASSAGRERAAFDFLQTVTPQISEAFDKKQENLRLLQQQAAGLAAQLAEKEKSVQALAAQLAEKESVLQSIFNSPGWKMLSLIHLLRSKIFPDGSRRERLLRLAVRAIYHLKQHGFAQSFRAAVSRIKNRGSRPVAAATLPPPGVTVRDGQPGSAPAISIVIEKNSALNLPLVSEEDVLAWASAQTLDGLEIITWDSAAGTASALLAPFRSWRAPDLETLCQGLAGRYLCMASPDLLRRNPVYLETNLLALESENLAFTLNVSGKSTELTASLEHQAALPGSRLQPYLRQVIRKECARNDFSLALAGCLGAAPGMAAVAGKIIRHTTAQSDEQSVTLLKTELPKEVEYKLSGSYLLVCESPQTTWQLPERVVHPVNTVMPAAPLPASLPTVLIFMPFLAVGGAERLALQLIRHLKDRVRFVVVTLEDMDAALGTTADFFHEAVSFVYTAADYLLPALNFSFLAYLIERFQVDTFYIANGANFIYDALGELRQKYPQLRIIDQVYDHQFGWINRYNPLVAAALDGCIAANPNITQAYLAHGVQPQRVHFVEHAVNLEDVNPENYLAGAVRQIRQALGLPLEKKIVTFCARLHPQKRPLDFIELARRFSNNPAVHFLMVGDGPLKAAIDQQVARTGLSNLTRHSFYSPVADIYAVTDVMVLPSEYEAMPLVVLESLAMGKPVVATEVGHIRDIVDETRGGKTIPNIGDVTSLRSALLQVLEQPIDADFMRQVIRRRFGVENIAEQYLKVWLGK